MRVVDAHQHFWRIGEHGCSWPDAGLAAIHRHIEAAELAPLLRAEGVAATVLVQSQANDADTDYLLRVAAATDFVEGVVGWVDLAAPAAPARIAALARHPKLRGLRPMLQAVADDAWLLDAALAPALAAMVAHDLSFDALVLPRHLGVLRRFAQRHPDLRIVIDHGAKPAIEADGYATWAAAIAPFAALPHVCCKLSGLTTQASAWQGADALQPFVSHLYRVFGADRLMWGSDWPVLALAPNPAHAGYGDWLALARRLLPTASDDAHAAIFGGTAAAFYRLRGR
jgi:L-fuconolactonase